MVELSILGQCSWNENLNDETRILRNRHNSWDRYIWRKSENTTCLVKIWFPLMFERNANDSKYPWNLLLVTPYECWFRDHVLGIQSAKVAEYERFFFLWYQSTQFTVMILISLLIKNHVQRLLMVKNQTAKWQIQVRKIIEGCS